MGRLFGTDGIRGVANVDLTPNLAYDLGRALGHYVDGAGRSVVVGRDTRRSGDMLVSALAAGLTSVGTDVVDIGVVPTPGLAYVAEHGDHVAGVMVSASHNPPDDNGLKVVSGGRKMDDEAEEQLERLIFGAEALPGPTNATLGRVRHDPGATEPYRAHLVGHRRGDAGGPAGRRGRRQRLSSRSSGRTSSASSVRRWRPSMSIPMGRTSMSAAARPTRPALPTWSGPRAWTWVSPSTATRTASSRSASVATWSTGTG